MKNREYVQNAFDNGLTLFEKLKSDIHDARNNLDWSDSGRQKYIVQLKERMGPKIDQAMHDAAVFVDGAKKKLVGQKKADAEKAGDTVHQMRLANAIKTLEMCGGRMTKQEVEGLIEPLKCDVNAKWPILAALESAGVTGFGSVWKEELFAHHARRDKEIAELEKLSRRLTGFWTLASAYDNMDALEIQFAIANIKDKINDFDEDMTYQG